VRTIIVTGSAGLIGSETVRHFAGEGARVVGIDNDMRARFFGKEASTQRTREELISNVRGYEHHDADIRDSNAMCDLFKTYSPNIFAVVHSASQPSHDWAARDPQTDFGVNANGTLNLLEAARQFCPEAPFVFLSTNKVYGDTPNRLPSTLTIAGQNVDTFAPNYRAQHLRFSSVSRWHSQGQPS